MKTVPEKIKIAITDDHALFRNGLAEMVQQHEQFEVALTAASAEELIKQLQIRSGIDIILLDIKMPGKSGIEILPEIAEIDEKIKVIMISMHEERSFVVKSMKGGARGYLLKDTEPEELYSAIMRTYEIGYYFSENTSKALVEDISKKQEKGSKLTGHLPELTSDDLALLEQICNGLKAAEIAKKLFKSPRTIEGHKARLLEKTQCKNAASLVAWAFRNGLLN